MREEAVKLFKDLQNKICNAVKRYEKRADFKSDPWKRTDLSGKPGGGGDTRVMQDGSLMEQAGVNFSEVHGILPAEMGEKLIQRAEELPFFAAGISTVMHPASPLVPTVHANFRYLEVGGLAWFGGGSDLTPYKLEAEDARHFHLTLKSACDKHDAEYYPRFKKWCDEYFFLPNRGESRGIGGIFFDYLGRGESSGLEKYYSFVADAGDAFISAYFPIVEKRMHESFSDAQREFQLLRRGRYVEFNLLYDRGTLFGLKTGGRTESILMSLPPLARWSYEWPYPEKSEEGKLISILKNPQAWAS